MSVWAQRFGERPFKCLRGLVGTCAGASASVGEVQFDTATPTAIGEAALDEPQLFQPGRDLTERLLGLRRASRDLGDRDSGARVDVLEQPEAGQRERTFGKRALSEHGRAGRDRPQQVDKPVLPSILGPRWRGHGSQLTSRAC